MSKGRRIDVSALIEDQKVNWFCVSFVAMACAIMFFEGYDQQVLAYAAPSIIKAWSVNRAYFGPVFSASLVGYIVGATLFSAMADRIGRRRIILAGVLLFGAFNLVTVYAHALTALLLLRFAAGIGFGASIPTTVALTVEYFPTRIRATMIGVLFFAYTVGAAIGGFIAAGLIPRFGWQSVFYVGGLAPIALAVLLMFALPESVRFLALQNNQWEKVAAILGRLRPELAEDLKASRGSIEFVLQEENRGGIPVQHLFADGRSRMTLLIWFAYITSLLALYFLISWLPTLLVGAGVSLAHAVITGGLLQAGGGTGILLLCWLLDRRGVIALSIAFALSAPLIAVIAAAARISDLLVMLVVFLSGLCLIGGVGGLNGVAGTSYPTYIRSTGTGWALGIGRIGSILGPVVGGVLIGLSLPTPKLFLFAAIPALFCAAAVYLLGDRLRAETVSGAPDPAGVRNSGSVRGSPISELRRRWRPRIKLANSRGAYKIAPEGNTTGSNIPRIPNRDANRGLPSIRGIDESRTYED